MIRAVPIAVANHLLVLSRYGEHGGLILGAP
jgi:hypothetical protein